MELYLDYIGLYAPLILFLLSIFLLRNMTQYLSFFVSGFILNNILNAFLKWSIKEPRPNDEQRAIEIGIVNGARIGFDKFGMPSGHAQNCGYCLTFITLALNRPTVTALYAVISVASLAQRYLYRNHTALQLLVGLLVGISVGYFTIWLTHRRLMGDLEAKRDDFGPI